MTLSLIGLPCLALAYPSTDGSSLGSPAETNIVIRDESEDDTYDPSQEGGTLSDDGSRGPLVQTGDYMRRERICAFLLAGEAVLLLALVTRSEYDDEYVYLTLA